MSAAVIHAPFGTPPSGQTPSRPNPALLDGLRNRIRAIERTGGGIVSPTFDSDLDSHLVGDMPVISLGALEIDEALPWHGLPRTGLHEVFGDAAALGFSAALLARLAEVHIDEGRGAPILWCQQGRDLYGRGLADYGIDPDRVILVHGKNDTEILWAMEEGLRSPGLAAVIGKLHKVPPIAGRRLQLAAEENGVAGLLLRATGYAGPQAPTGAALTRWRATSAPSITPASGLGLGPPQWNLELQRCRLSAASPKQLENAGRPRLWRVEWCHETGDLSVVASLRDRSDRAPAKPAAWIANSGQSNPGQIPGQGDLWQAAV
jgi:protein ImuA